MIHGAALSPLAPKTRGAVVPRGHWADKDNIFTYEDVKFPYETVKPSEVMDKLKQGWTILDVRQPEQIERAQIHDAVEVPIYVTKNDMSPIGIYQEAVSFGLGGWWMGGRPMKENDDFVSQVQKNVGKSAPGIIAVCQSGLRSKQALKELHMAGYPHLALVKGGLNAVRHNELPCAEEGCRLDLAGSGNIAGML